MHAEYDPTTVDWEIFMLKIICVKSFCVDKFPRFVRFTVEVWTCMHAYSLIIAA